MNTIISMYDFFPYVWIIHLVRAIISFDVIHVVLKDRFNTAVTFLSIVIPSMLYSYFSLNFIINRHNELLIMLLYYVFQLIIVFIVTEGKPFTKMLSILLAFTAYLCGGILFSLLLSVALGSDYSVMLSTKTTLFYFLFNTLTIFAFHFITLAIIKRIKDKTGKNCRYKTNLSIFFIYPITHIIFIYQFFSIFMSMDDPLLENYYKMFPNTDLFCTIVIMLCIVIDFCIIFITDYIEKINEKNINNEKELLKNQMDYQQMLMLKEEKQEFRKIKHDFINITTTAKGFIEIGKPEKALSILTSTNEDLTGLAGFSICSNETINTILYIKQQQAKNSDIHFITNISENYAVLLDDYDFCRLLNNIIDNALNAAFMLKGNKECKIEIEIDKSSIIIKSENGFIEKETKRKKDGHGNGIGIIKEIASKYGGKYSTRQENDVWYTETFLLNKKPSDSTPPKFGLTTRF